MKGLPNSFRKFLSAAPFEFQEGRDFEDSSPVLSQLVQCRFQLSTPVRKIHGNHHVPTTPSGQWQGYARQKLLYFDGIATPFWC